MTVFEINGKLLIVDVGVLFPEEHQPGIDVILPDFGYLKDRMDDVIGIFLTHGHEDHIGGVPYLLRMKEDIPLLGSALTLAFVEAKLKEHAGNLKRAAVELGILQLKKLISAADPNNEFETVPAYIRRNLHVHNTALTSVEKFYSNYTVKSDENNKGQISTINTFLDGKKPD